jgi:hypothetical protein
MTQPGSRISAAELTQAAFSGVLAALKEHQIDPKQFPGPILAGIIAWPELSQFRSEAAQGLGKQG